MHTNSASQERDPATRRHAQLLQLKGNMYSYAFKAILYCTFLMWVDKANVAIAWAIVKRKYLIRSTEGRVPWRIWGRVHYTVPSCPKICYIQCMLVSYTVFACIYGVNVDLYHTIHVWPMWYSISPLHVFAESSDERYPVLDKSCSPTGFRWDKQQMLIRPRESVVTVEWSHIIYGDEFGLKALASTHNPPPSL